MDETAFWALIEAANAEARKQQADRAEILQKKLQTLPARIRSIFTPLFFNVYRWDLWAAAHIIGGGITTLSPGQLLECHLTKRSDGTLVVTEIKLSVGERAAAIADLERQAQTAEQNYRIELRRRRVH